MRVATPNSLLSAQLQRHLLERNTMRLLDSLDWRKGDIKSSSLWASIFVRAITTVVSARQFDWPDWRRWS